MWWINLHIPNIKLTIDLLSRTRLNTAMEEKQKNSVGTKINDTIFQIGFRTAKDYQFDFYLPTVEKIIRSIKIT